MASVRGHSTLPFPDLGKEDEDVPAAGFSTDSTELWKEPGAPSARNTERTEWSLFLTGAPAARPAALWECSPLAGARAGPLA